MKGLIELLKTEWAEVFCDTDYYDTMTVKISHSDMEKLRKLEIMNNNMGIEIEFTPLQSGRVVNDTIDGLAYSCKFLDDTKGEVVMPPKKSNIDWNKWFETIRNRCFCEPKTEVIFNEPATILYKDGKKYVCKCDKEDKFSEELGLALCLLKSFGVSYSDFEKLLKSAKRQGKKDE